MPSLLLTTPSEVLGVVPVLSPLEAFFSDPDHEGWVIPSAQVLQHKDEAVGWLTETLPDPGMAIFWQETSVELFLAQGGLVPDWVHARMEILEQGVPEGSVIIGVEYVLNDPFAFARCARTGTEMHFALWDGDGQDGHPHGEVAFDWDTVLPAHLAATARRSSPH